MRENGCLFAVLAFIMAIGVIFGLAAIGWWLWGLIAVGIFALPALTYWQFFGLYWLCGLLFRGGAGASKIVTEWSKK